MSLYKTTIETILWSKANRYPNSYICSLQKGEFLTCLECCTFDEVVLCKVLTNLDLELCV